MFVLQPRVLAMARRFWWAVPMLALVERGLIAARNRDNAGGAARGYRAG